MCVIVNLFTSNNLIRRSLPPVSVFLILALFSFLMVLINGGMNFLLNKSNMGKLIISGSMNSLSCTFMTGQKSLVVRLVKGLWRRILLIIGQTHLMSKSVDLLEIVISKNHQMFLHLGENAIEQASVIGSFCYNLYGCCFRCYLT